jgi:hypothetical protein
MELQDNDSSYSPASRLGQGGREKIISNCFYLKNIYFWNMNSAVAIGVDRDQYFLKQ